MICMSAATAMLTRLKCAKKQMAANNATSRHEWAKRAESGDVGRRCDMLSSASAAAPRPIHW
jgi:hypothetical protein